VQRRWFLVPQKEKPRGEVGLDGIASGVSQVTRAVLGRHSTSLAAPWPQVGWLVGIAACGDRLL
jgi:hypothetical protein